MKAVVALYAFVVVPCTVRGLSGKYLAILNISRTYQVALM